MTLGIALIIILKCANRGYKVQELSDFISTVGFPIVVSVAMFYQNNVLSNNYQKLTQQLQQKIEANTEIITRLVEKLDKDEILKKDSDKQWLPH